MKNHSNNSMVQAAGRFGAKFQIFRVNGQKYNPICTPPRIHTSHQYLEDLHWFEAIFKIFGWAVFEAM